jgi:ABC-type multidrug transport system ATPase subunit
VQNIISIHINNAGKKFGKEWIFRNISLEINSGEKIVILGLNGSGKSTFLQTLTGYLTLNEGSVVYQSNNHIVEDDKQYNFISLASPYLELIEDFTLQEQILHASIYKPFLKDITIQKVIELSGLSAHKDKHISLFSSGMRQRLKLTLAILANTPVLFLDEPTTNLDATVINWYQTMIQTYAMHKTIIVCSNSIKEEYDFCTKVVTMEDYKK